MSFFISRYNDNIVKFLARSSFIEANASLKLESFGKNQVVCVTGGKLKLSGLGDEVAVNIIKSELRLGYLEADGYALTCSDFYLFKSDKRLDRTYR